MYMCLSRLSRKVQFKKRLKFGNDLNVHHVRWKSAYLSVCFVYVSVCANVQLKIHSPENTNKITGVRTLACSTFHLTFTATIYDRKKCLLSLHQAYGSGEINK